MNFTNLTVPEIYQKLKNSIIKLEYRPGEKISENEIAREYGVSRTPIKAAFTRLEHEGFLLVLPQRGTYVSLLDTDKIKACIYIRNVLERDAAEQFMLLCDDDDRMALKNIIKKQKQLLTQNPIPTAEFYLFDTMLHGHIFKRVGLLNVWEELLRLEVDYTRFRMYDIVCTEQFERLIAEHEKLVVAINNRDKIRYNQILAEHLMGNFDRVEQIIKNDVNKGE